MLFSKPMVLALLAGKKSQTRRLVFRGEPGDLIWVRETWRTYRSLNGERPVDLWHAERERGAALFYDAGGSQYISRGLGDREWSQDDEDDHPGAGKTRSALYLPRWGSRLTLRVLNVRQERLQDISDEDALAEGIDRLDPTADDYETERHQAELEGRQPYPVDPVWTAPGTRQGFGPRRGDPQWGPTPGCAYALVWKSLHGEGSWEANPLVHAITFDVLRENIGRVRAGQEENDHGNA